MGPDVHALLCMLCPKSRCAGTFPLYKWNGRLQHLQADQELQMILSPATILAMTITTSHFTAKKLPFAQKATGGAVCRGKNKNASGRTWPRSNSKLWTFLPEFHLASPDIWTKRFTAGLRMCDKLGDPPKKNTQKARRIGFRRRSTPPKKQIVINRPHTHKKRNGNRRIPLVSLRPGPPRTRLSALPRGAGAAVPGGRAALRRGSAQHLGARRGPKSGR